MTLLTVFDEVVTETPSTFKLASCPNCPVLNAMLPDEAPDSTLETVSCPAAPLVPLTSESRDPDESVMTLALTPIPAELMAADRDANVVSLSLLSTLNVCP